MKITSVIEKIYTNPYLRIMLHFFFWLFMFGIRLYLTNVSFNVYRGFSSEAYVYISLSSTLLMTTFYYAFMYAIVPNLILKRKYLLSGLSILLLIISYTIADAYAEINLIQNCKTCLSVLHKFNSNYESYLNRGLINVILTRLLSLGTPMTLLFALCIPFSIKMTLQAYRDKIRSLQLAKENLQLEFSFLKSQFNPHFLFNSMNNIYGLIISGDTERSAALVARLSEFLRYALYDSEHEVMPVEKEVKLLKDYIELEKIRLNDAKVHFECTLDNNDYNLAPLLLIPLIENAFKYSSDTPASFIHISMSILNGHLSFTIDNSIDPDKQVITGGIGLCNFTKRLKLYYKERYKYEVGILNNKYSVNLIIQIT
ncbi:sensor histidine kinase [Arcticibacter svalbardensis]|nr:sensor histidine kinase [Arcticibacter svalbardensis]